MLLACWAVYSGVLMWLGREKFEVARQVALDNPQLGDAGLMMVERARRAFQVMLAIKAIGVPLLLWLAWTMGRPKVAAQFHTRRR